MDNKKVGAFISERRKVKQLTQQQLADKLGISNKAVSKWETGQGMPDIGIITALAEIFGVTADELLNGEQSSCEKTDKKYENEATTYLVNKCILKFKLAATLSVIPSIIGLIIPYFIWKETKDYSGILFGIWLQICSGGIFTFYYIIARNQIESYNRSSINKIDSVALRNQYLKVCMWLWAILPIALLISVICDLASFGNMIKIVVAIIVYIIVVFVCYKNVFSRKTETKQDV